MMAKPLLIVVAQDERTGNIIAKQLHEFTQQHINIKVEWLEQGIKNLDKADLVLVTLPTYASIVAKQVKPGTDILVVRRTLLLESWERILSIPSQTKAMLVNDTKEAAEETIALLYELGAKHLELFPVYPGMEQIPDLEFAITPGEKEFVPAKVQRIIDIGHRVIDAGTVADILSKFNLLDFQANKNLARYMEKTLPRSPGLKSTISWLTDMRRQVESILDIINEGVIAYDFSGRINFFNRLAEEILDKNRLETVGQKIHKNARIRIKSKRDKMVVIWLKKG
jgi:PAS domain-containing protein